MLRLFEKLLFVFPVSIVSRLKIILYRLLGMSIGVKNRFEGGKVRNASKIVIGNNNAFFGGGYMLWPVNDNDNSVRISIGNNNLFNRNIYLDACGLISIGNGCLFGPDVYVTDSNHQYKVGISSKDLPMDIGKVTIGNNCWIGARAVILKNVQLGDHCIVAAGAVVTKSFPSGSIVGGVPARLIKSIID